MNLPRPGCLIAIVDAIRRPFADLIAQEVPNV